MAQPSEKEITKEVRKLLFKEPEMFHYKAWQGLGSERGIPDIIACYKGRFVGIEVKTQKGKISEKQDAKRRGIVESGGRYFVVRSEDEMADALKILRGEDGATHCGYMPGFNEPDQGKDIEK